MKTANYLHRLLMLRRSITGKLILMLLLFSVFIISAMAVATRLSLQEGFLEYVTEAELDSFDDTVAGLSAHYARAGEDSWDFIRRDHRLWQRLMPHVKDLPSRPERRQYQGDRPRHRPGPPPPIDKTGVTSRLRLLDKQQRRVTGPPSSTGEEELRPIYLQGEVIGWLSLTPVPLPIEGIDHQFQLEQVENIWPIALGALALAILLGIPVGRRFVRPVKAVAKGAHQLAEGRFDTRITVASRDELGQLGDDFNALATALERNEKLRRQSMADTSHELRTPLAVIRGEIEAMQDGIRPMDQQQLGKLHDSIMQLNRLVDDLYDLALTDAGALSYRKEQLDLTEILSTAAEAMGHSAEQVGLRLNLEALPDQVVPVFGDSRRLRQVVDNLLKNSCRYTDAGGEICINLWQTDEQVCFSIEDSSPGVAPETLPHLFERFYREEKSRNRASGGAGLGLAICHNIVAAHQGSIVAETAELGGLKVVVTLPRAAKGNL